ncbi:MAG: tetratricopeptide repeat protein [Planctomycetota bacterium]|jgi:tetratricopeptide (TPR) repeat protein|nr:tetratricopeptide repeat protein [Planctomycetota bacterium]MDP6762016.1 tetratricopeptide repeat protein [Planctomycetota bacterium]MDP6990669.1 tetratricopeptide repeat protein [Planctomycetota bacterium]
MPTIQSATGQSATGRSATGALARAGRGALIALITLAAYWPTLSGELVYDDHYIIAQNPLIRSIANLPEIFASSYWDFLDPQTASRVGYYRPLSMTVLTMGHAWGGGDPWHFHFLSITLHILASLAAWRFAARLSGDGRIGFWAGLLFALHPIHVESVAWISAVNDPLFALFGLLSLASFVRWRDEGSVGAPWRAGLLLLPALFCKEAAVSVVAVALAVDVARHRREGEAGPFAALAPITRAYFPFLVAGLAWYAARVAAFGDPLAGFDRTTTEFNVSPARLLLLRAEILGGAAGLLAWPGDLNLFRPFRPTVALTHPAILSALIWSGALVASIVVLALRRQRFWLGLVLIAPAGILPVVARVTSVGTFPLSDRFLYLSTVSVALLAAAFALRRLARPAGPLVLTVLAGAYGLRTHHQIDSWLSEEDMFRAAVDQNPRNPNVHWGLGRVLLERYRATGEWDALSESRACFNDSMDLLEAAVSDDLAIFATRDDHLQTNLGLAWTYVFEAQFDPYHDFETARVVFTRITQHYPTSERAFVGLGVTSMFEGELEAAGKHLRKALDLNERSPEAHHNMGRVLMRLKDYGPAAEHFRAALGLREANLGDMVGLAQALDLDGRPAEALGVARRAHERHPRAGDPMVLLGKLAAADGRFGEALSWLDRAVAAEPHNGAGHLDRGKVLMLIGRFADATEALGEACRIMPDHFEAHYKLGALLLERSTNAREAALPFLLVAYRTRPDDVRGRELHKALSAMPIDSADYLFALAEADADAGRRVEALAWAERALAVEVEHGPTLFLVGMIVKDQEDLQGEDALIALDHLRRSVAAMGDSYVAHFEYGKLLGQLGQPGEAVGVLERALELLADEPLSAEERAHQAAGLREALEQLRELVSEGANGG